MSRKRWWAVAIGLAAGVGILLALRPMTQTFQMQASFRGTVWPSLLWAVVLGIGVGGLAIAAVRFDPLVAAVPAFLVSFIFLPLFIDLSVPDWYPNWVRWRVLAGFGLLPYAIVGVLTAAGSWPAIERRWFRPGGRPHGRDSDANGHGPLAKGRD